MLNHLRLRFENKSYLDIPIDLDLSGYDDEFFLLNNPFEQEDSVQFRVALQLEEGFIRELVEERGRITNMKLLNDNPKF